MEITDVSLPLCSTVPHLPFSFHEQADTTHKTVFPQLPFDRLASAVPDAWWSRMFAIDESSPLMMLEICPSNQNSLNTPVHPAS